LLDASARCNSPVRCPSSLTFSGYTPPTSSSKEPRAALFHSENRLCAPAHARSSARARPPSASRRCLHWRPRVGGDKPQLGLPLPGDIRVLRRKPARLENQFSPLGIA